ncbi:MAG: GNAT family N-acetyltransferase [Bauldia sp.]|nr:GNAT family N-acetyltransferase [Bauldia sp.]
MDVVECVGTEAFQAVWPVMRQLRNMLSENQFLARVKAAQGEGYRLCAAIHDGRPVGAIGWRIVHDLASGRSLYIDDLVADEAARGTGVGRRLMEFARAEAVRQSCNNPPPQQRLPPEKGRTPSTKPLACRSGDTPSARMCRSGGSHSRQRLLRLPRA